MAFTCFSQIIYNALLMQATSGAYAEDSLGVSCSTFALRAEATLTPQYRLANHSFSKIIGRIYLLMTHEGPEMFSLIIDTQALTRQRLTTAGPFFQQSLYPPYQWLHLFLKYQPFKVAISYSISQRQNRGQSPVFVIFVLD